MLLVYGDDSADEKAQRVCAVVGVVGTDLAWKDLEEKWIQRIERTHPGIPFHATYCESDQGNYKRFPHLENKALYRDLVTLIVNSPICGFGHAIDLTAQRQIYPGFEELSYYRAFLEVLKSMKDIAKVN